MQKNLHFYYVKIEHLENLNFPLILNRKKESIFKSKSQFPLNNSHQKIVKFQEKEIVKLQKSNHFPSSNLLMISCIL
jgi:hypothetical protein